MVLPLVSQTKTGSRSGSCRSIFSAFSRRFGLTQKGALQPGKDADVVVWDPNAPRDYGTHTSFMNVDYDLYEGETASASVRHTFCRGTMVYDQGEILTAPGHGRFVKRSLAGTV